MEWLKITKHTNNLLLGLIIAVNLYVILTPLVPSLLFVVRSHGGQRQQLVQKLHTKNAAAGGQSQPNPAAQANQLIIPAMLLNQAVLEGHDTYAVLNKGILHWPASSTPDKGGNTVLIGHRFTYSLPKGVFYHLDKLKIGDEIGLTWDNKQYLYKVADVTVVPPTQTSILDATNDSRLTLFTCAPLLWPKNRLVVVAKLIHNSTQETTAP